jgi:aminopeptidase N
VFVDDIVVSTGQGTTSFEDDGNVMDGWLAKRPLGSPPNQNNWIAGTVADAPPPIGEFMRSSLRRQPEIIRFLEEFAGPYPFDVAGGIVDNVPIGFALENQTRPIYSPFFFLFDPFSAEFVIVHELAHQWYGDSLTVKQWQHIWLNEGFATYTEWLWAEAQGFGTAQETFDFLYAEIVEDDPFWQLTIGDPGPEHLFDGEVYTRGAMTLHALRMAVGEEDFFRILRRWAQNREGELVTTPQFVRLAERISGEQLDELFDAWLFTSAKPELDGAALSQRSVESSRHRQTAAARHLIARLKLDHALPRSLR